MVLMLTRSDVARLLVLDEVIAEVEQAHAALATGRAVLPAPTVVALPGMSTLLIPMVAALGPQRALGAKLLTDSPDNPGHGRPRQQSTIVLADVETGGCDAVLDGAAITLIRTAAASAVATRHLANPAGGVLGLIGAGAQARAHLAALRAVRPIERVLVWSRTRANADRFAAENGRLPAEFRHQSTCDTTDDLVIEVVDSPEKVVRAADILCTLTPAREPIVRGGWFAPGLHVNAVGAPPRPGYREIDTEGIRRSRVVVDSAAVVTAECDDVRVPLAEQAITDTHVRDEIGQVITGDRPGRTGLAQITLYKSVGVAVQDMATARRVVDLARSVGIGVDIDLAGFHSG